ncbi:hypothetical protein BV20DRAFT_973849 [Pilatotrama ljubarskyi]|nr:hypothetical protein BV20DRAFT_973849 [Pilatotrama ljubarskyi]
MPPTVHPLYVLALSSPLPSSPVDRHASSERQLSRLEYEKPVIGHCHVSAALSQMDREIPATRLPVSSEPRESSRNVVMLCFPICLPIGSQ